MNQRRHQKQERPVAAILMASGVLMTGVLATAAYAVEVSSTSIAPVPAEAPFQPVKPPVNTQGFADGVYLYGETSQPDQIGAAYFVFEVTDNQVIGASYFPQSSFDCFQGEFQGDRLAVNGVNSYDQTAYAYSLPVEQQVYVAEAGSSLQRPTGLQGLYAIESVSQNDQRLLATCKADFQ